MVLFGWGDEFNVCMIISAVFCVLIMTPIRVGVYVLGVAGGNEDAEVAVV